MPIETKWLVYGDGGAPFWVVLLMLAIALVAAHFWLTAERRRRAGFFSRCLPWTLTLIMVLSAWAAWRPVLVKITTRDEPCRILAVLDSSESMSALLGCRDLSDKLDALALRQPDAILGRNVTAARLASDIEEAGAGSVRWVDALSRLGGQAGQGIPFGQDDARIIHDAARWIRDGYIRWNAMLDEVIRTRQESPPESEISPDSVIPVKAFQDLLIALLSAADEMDPASESSDESFPAILLGASSNAEQALARAVEHLTAFPGVADSLRRHLVVVRNSEDEAFFDARKSDLGAMMAEIESFTRADAASALAARLPSEVTIFAPATDNPRETDLYQAIEKGLDFYENEKVSHVAIFSDGGHNADEREEIITRLDREGIELLVAGVGFPPPDGPDFAILDWSAPSLARAGRAVNIDVTLKTQPGMTNAFALKLSGDKSEPVKMPLAAKGDEIMTVRIPWTAPSPGRHFLRLDCEVEGDYRPDNNTVGFAIDAVDRMPELLWIGLYPDWDVAYFRLALDRMGLRRKALFTGGRKPRRGHAGDAVPSTLEQWAGRQVVVLQDPVFEGFSDADAEVLFRLVTENGASLLILPNGDGGYQAALASRFGWDSGGKISPSGKVRMTAAARDLPMMKLDYDGARSARRFADMGRPENVFGVPAQDVALVESDDGTPVCSLGFYGRGKAVFWGLRGMYPMREYNLAPGMDRLLDGLLGELATSLWSDPDQPACYPPMPVFGSENLLLALGQGADHATADGAVSPIPLRSGVNNRIGILQPNALQAQVSVDGKSATFQVADNPNMESLFHEFDEGFLKSLAAKASGRYFRATDAVSMMEGVRPHTQRISEAMTFPAGGHPSVLVAIILLLAVHWVFRKLAGMAI